LNYFVHNIDPIIFTIGPLRIGWYGLSYLVSFVIGFLLVKKNLARQKVSITDDHYYDFILYIFFGVVLGGRLGYVFFYGLSDFIENPLSVFYVWQGGMSFHGGMLGTICLTLLFCKRYKYHFYTLVDPTMPLVAIGVGLVRIANFINGELYGSPTTLPWAVIFIRDDIYKKPRHPSQLYEALLEGFFMAILLQFLLSRNKIKGMIFWLFIFIYGVVRYLIEFIRLPDDLPIYDNGLLFGFLPVSMGQLLSLGMIAVSAVFIVIITKRHFSDGIRTTKTVSKQPNKK